MNYTPLDQAYNIQHIKSNVYGGIIHYSPVCIFCKNNSSIPLFPSGTDGGSFRQCSRCKKNFRANVINNAINNFSYSTEHLKGTN
jgi:hypothetical protein